MICANPLSFPTEKRSQVELSCFSQALVKQQLHFSAGERNIFCASCYCSLLKTSSHRLHKPLFAEWGTAQEEHSAAHRYRHREGFGWCSSKERRFGILPFDTGHFGIWYWTQRIWSIRVLCVYAIYHPHMLSISAWCSAHDLFEHTD